MERRYETQYFNNIHTDKETAVKDIIARVYSALDEKGYNPVNQFVGYIMSEIGRASCRERV